MSLPNSRSSFFWNPKDAWWPFSRPLNFTPPPLTLTVQSGQQCSPFLSATLDWLVSPENSSNAPQAIVFFKMLQLTLVRPWQRQVCLQLLGHVNTFRKSSWCIALGLMLTSVEVLNMVWFLRCLPLAVPSVCGLFCITNICRGRLHG